MNDTLLSTAEGNAHQTPAANAVHASDAARSPTAWRRKMKSTAASSDAPVIRVAA